MVTHRQTHMDIFPWGYNASALFQNAEKHQQDVVEWLELSFYIPFQGCYIKLGTYTYLENPLTKYMSYRHKPKSIFSFFYIPHHLKKVVGRKKKKFLASTIFLETPIIWRAEGEGSECITQSAFFGSQVRSRQKTRPFNANATAILVQKKEKEELLVA